MKKINHIKNQSIQVLKDCWKDSVWSKVIATGIIGAITGLGIVLKSLVSDMPFTEAIFSLWRILIQNTLVPNWVILVATFTIIFSLIKPVSNLIRSLYQSKELDDSIEDAGSDYHIDPGPEFSTRVAKSFPALRGFEIIDNPKNAIQRLEVLLKKPLHHRGAYIMFWHRGPSCNYITSFKRLKGVKVLMNFEEMIISRVAAYHSGSYYKDFVYVEVSPDQQSGVFNYSKDHIQSHVDKFGYSWEEYGMLGSKLISRQEYEDGSAIMNGKLVDASNAILRTRYLSKYNFLIVSTDSPFMSFDEEVLEEYLNRILKGENLLDKLVEIAERLSKRTF